MADTAWLRSSPTDPDTANVDDDIRATKQGLDQRMIQGGHLIASGPIPTTPTTENDDGKHIVGVETQTNQDNRGYWRVYDNTKTSGGGSHGAGSALFEVQGSAGSGGAKVSALGGAIIVGPNVTSGLDPGHLHTQGGPIGGKAGPIALGYLKPSAFRWAKGANEGTQTVLALHARLGIVPTGGSLVIEVRKTTGAPAVNADVYTDGVANVVVGTITVNSGDFGGSVTGLAVVLADGEVLVLKATTVNGTPSDLVVNAVITG